MLLRLTHSRPGEDVSSKILHSWEGLVWLERRPNRKGEPRFYIRATIGELPQWHIGPFDELEEAKHKFDSIVARLEDGLEDLVLDAMNVDGDWVSREA